MSKLKNNTTFDSININETNISKGMELYYARIIPRVGMCYVQTMTVRTIYEDKIVGLDTVTMNAQMVDLDCLGKTLFTKRKDADELVKKTLKSGAIKELKREE